MREELDEVERAYQQQRSELLTEQRGEWDRTMSSRRSKELEYLEHLLRRVEDYENQLHQLRVQDSEEYNATKIRLENEVQVCAQRKRRLSSLPSYQRLGTPLQPPPLFRLKLVYSYVIEVADSEYQLRFDRRPLVSEIFIFPRIRVT